MVHQEQNDNMPLLLPLFLSLYQRNDTDLHSVYLHLLFKGHTLVGIFINVEEREKGREKSKKGNHSIPIHLKVGVSHLCMHTETNVHTCTHTQQTSFPFHHPPNFASFSYTIFLCKCIDPFIGTRSDAFKATL